MNQRAKQIIAGMKVWYAGKNRCAADVRTRTPEQKAWDSAILMAAEFIRRYDNYDEERSLAILQLGSTELPKG